MNRSPMLVAAALLALAGCKAEGDRPGVIVMPDMVWSVPYDPYDPSPVFAGGQTLALPPEGTIPHGGVAFPYGPGKEEAARAAQELRNPLPDTPEVRARGKKIFETFCFVCHGLGGMGDGPIIGRFPNPPALLADHAKNLKDGQIFHIATRGQGLMRPYAAQVLPKDRWAVVRYIRTLQNPPAVAEAPAGVAPEGGPR